MSRNRVYNTSRHEKDSVELVELKGRLDCRDKDLKSPRHAVK